MDFLFLLPCEYIFRRYLHTTSGLENIQLQVVFLFNKELRKDHSQSEVVTQKALHLFDKISYELLYKYK